MPRRSPTGARRRRNGTDATSTLPLVTVPGRTQNATATSPRVAVRSTRSRSSSWKGPSSSRRQLPPQRNDCYLAFMQTAALVEGRYYVFREKPRAGTPMLKVKLVEKVGRRGHVKIRFEDGPHPGLEEYINVRQLVVPWGERKALLRDEERLARIEQTVKRDLAREEAI